METKSKVNIIFSDLNTKEITLEEARQQIIKLLSKESTDESIHTLDINTILHTKNGRKTGNGIVTGRVGRFWEVTTDYGHKLTLTSNEVDELFHIAWVDYSKEKNAFTCHEMQVRVAATHKHRVVLKQ